MQTIFSDNRLKDTSSGTKSKPDISVVIPAYNEEENIPELYKELLSSLDTLGETWEIIFVDDGSSGKTWNIIQSLYGTDKRVKGIQFSRNFGHQYALFAGLLAASGDAVVSMDADLQHPPSVIPDLVREWKKGYKIVNTIRNDLESLSGFKKVTSNLYYRIFSFITGVKIRPGMADFRLLDRKVVESILQFGEEGLFLRGIVQWIGFPTTSIPFKCRERYKGTPKYNFKKMMKFGIEGVTSFSIIPLRIGIVIGILTSLFSFYLIIDSLYAYYNGITVPGWTTTTILISLMFGILFILLGLIGEYIGKILVQVRARPRFIVSNYIGEDERMKGLANHKSDEDEWIMSKAGRERDAS